VAGHRNFSNPSEGGDEGERVQEEGDPEALLGKRGQRHPLDTHSEADQVGGFAIGEVELEDSLFAVVQLGQSAAPLSLRVIGMSRDHKCVVGGRLRSPAFGSGRYVG
jgi:hypothetical protein